MLLPQGAWVLSLGEEIRSHKLSGVINKNGKKIIFKNKEKKLCPSVLIWPVARGSVAEEVSGVGWGRGTLSSKQCVVNCQPPQCLELLHTSVRRGHKPDLSTVHDPATSTLESFLLIC